ncbi:MAG TPA: 30S ribosomal protein S18 [Candidatus Paceibacterota bacterium]|nr:30S ribosomal protein S18 [Candidatus Paceibacterota bacterium]HRZ34170.1 30S ribosomal protein S18 [Candidatus Paceibacterota bacterium]
MKSCFFKENDINNIDYKDVHVLSKFLTPQGRIISNRRSGVSAKMQRKLAEAVKRARFMGLLPFINR